MRHVKTWFEFKEEFCILVDMTTTKETKIRESRVKELAKTLKLHDTSKVVLPEGTTKKTAQGLKLGDYFKSI
jgi:hypothetical protein